MSYPITVTGGQVRFLLDIFYWNFAFCSFDENTRSLGFRSCFFAGERFFEAARSGSSRSPATFHDPCHVGEQRISNNLSPTH